MMVDEADLDVGPYLDDLMLALRDLRAESVHCVVGSPPVMDVMWLRPVFDQLRRALVATGVVWLDLGGRDGGQWCGEASWQLVFGLQREGWLLRNVVIWYRRGNVRYRTLFLLVRQGNYWFDLDGLREPGSNDRGPRNPGDVWLVESGLATLGLPASVVWRCVSAGCPQGGLVVDPFGNSATTRRVTRQLRRRFFGMGEAAEYQDIAC